MNAHKASVARSVTTATRIVVASVLRRGYRIGDRVLRPAMVGVVDRADDGTASETPVVEPDES